MPRCKYGVKQKNFPGRVNERRAGALRRIEAQLADGSKRQSRLKVPLTPADRRRLGREADALALRITPADSARAIRTKKDRRGTGKLSRTGA